MLLLFFFFFQAEDGIRDIGVTGVQTCALPISRADRKKGGAKDLTMNAEATSHLQKLGIAPTDDSHKFIWDTDVETDIKAIFTFNGYVDSTDGVEGGCGLVLGATSCYAEQGGQIFDTGSITGSDGTKFEIESVQVFAGFVVHIGAIAASGSVKVGDKVKVSVDYARRQLVAPNHTCTHVLNLGLWKVLGDHIDQKGSMVQAERLRFDFSHGKAMDLEELARVDTEVNGYIRQNAPVDTRVTSPADAPALGAQALFREKYAD